MVLFFAALSVAHGQDFAGDEPVIYPPDVLPEDEVRTGELRVDGGGALVLEHTSVVAEVAAGLARVTLVEWFTNPYDTPLEATYLLPLPVDSAVDRMDLTCGDRQIDGVVMERQAARALYDQAKAEGRKAALLEQQRDNLFTQHVSGLCPGETVEVTLQYVEQLPYEDGVYGFVFPMTVGPRFSPPWVEDAAALETPYARTGRDVDVTVYIDEGMPVESMWSDSHDVVVEREDAHGMEVALDASDTIPNRDFEMHWTLAGEQPRAAVVAHRTGDQPGYLALTVEPQVLGDLFQPRPRELLFVLDASCSMAGQPWALASATVGKALDAMNPDDTFDLVTFSNDSDVLFPEPQPATAAAIAQARQWLRDAYDGGGTNMDRGIVRSLELPGDPERMRLVLMLTDGWIGGEDDMFAIVRDHLHNARLFSLGIGEAPNRYLLEGLAGMGRGDVAYQRMNQPIDETVDAFYERIAHPAMSDLTIDWGGLTVTEQYPKKIPDLWAGQPIRVVARYEGSGPTTVTVTGKVGRETFVQHVDVDLPAQVAGNDEVESLWARRKIRDLEWYPHDKTPDQVRAAVTAVALRHGLVSKYTSLVAVDDRPSRCGPASLSVTVPNETPAGTGGGTGEGRGGGTGYGMGGLGAYGTGIGGGGSAIGYGGGLGTKGVGAGSSGYGVGMAGGGLTGLEGAGLVAELDGTRGEFGRRVGAADAGSSAEAIARIGSSGVLGAVGERSADAVIVGSLDRTTISDVITRHLNQIRYCYQRALQKQPDIEGKVVITFEIDEDGKVKTAQVKSSTLGSPEVESCLVGRFLRMQFPDTGGNITVSYPFVFQKGS
jgi:Ca-activated chloride channel family protein